MKKVAVGAGIMLALTLAAGQAVAADGRGGPRHGGWGGPPKHGGWNQGCPPGPRPGGWGNYRQPWYGPYYGGWGYRPLPPPPPLVVYNPPMYYPGYYPGYYAAPRWQ